MNIGSLRVERRAEREQVGGLSATRMRAKNKRGALSPEKGEVVLNINDREGAPLREGALTKGIETQVEVLEGWSRYRGQGSRRITGERGASPLKNC